MRVCHRLARKFHVLAIIEREHLLDSTFHPKISRDDYKPRPISDYANAATKRRRHMTIASVSGREVKG